MIQNIDIDLEFQEYISGPPIHPKELQNRACSNDAVTIDTWKETWLKQVTHNHKTYGPFRDNSVGELFNINSNKPCIIVGSGPSLKKNVAQLREAKKAGMFIVSCLHNFHFLEDNGVEPDYYVTLDAGPITIAEISEGGTKTEEEYFELTKNRKLLAFIGSHPDLIKKWKGEVKWFNAPLPDPQLVKDIDAVEYFNTYVSTGGNVLGACFYIAKGIFGSNPIIFVGADFSFSYTKNFHGWSSQYDKNIGPGIRAVDIFGNKVLTWPSYLNFKFWFDGRCTIVPGIYINATEGGLLGAYPEGNIAQIKQMMLKDVVEMFTLNRMLKAQCEDPLSQDRVILF